ncbi:putative Peroxidasin-like protein [Hypsibius exemplaris]|uniref:Peroxidasin-like protein n=1 Tax=Hypsibius exemplaris TaxID=2072580 RepID=A0A1W0X5L1_HYPEX|nr:putative Peroxidasin-like protein [Hypsibius exemplaris]
MVQSRLVRMNANFQEVGTIPLRTTFFKAGNIYKQGMIDELVRGMATLPGKKISDSVTPDLSQSLFPNPKTPQFGHDLVSLNIQRGRDHGINGYMEWRKLCKLPTANSFEALKKLNVMPSQVVDKLKSVYESVADIDLYPAGLSENRSADGLVGKTFSCILAEQFGRLRTGDRFWYENDLPLPSRLTNEQLKAIRQTSMASIICSTTTNLKAIQPRVFETITQLGNKRVDCSSIPGLDLQPWRRA